MLRILKDLRGKPRRKAALAAASAALVLTPLSVALAVGNEPLPAVAASASAPALHAQDVSAQTAVKLTGMVHKGFAAEAAVKVRGEAEKVLAAERAAEEEAERARAEAAAAEEARAREAAAAAAQEVQAPAAVPAQQAPPAPPPAPAPAPAPAPVQPAVDRVIHVALAGGQNVVDMGAGPVLFPLPAGWPPYVAEHDSHGGWARFGTLSHGMTVTMTGLVTGTYTVGEIINVPRGGNASHLTFSSMPKVMLQTCIPGTDRMVVVGLY